MHVPRGLLALASVLAATGCRPTAPTAAPPAAQTHAAPTNRIDINATVRQNLGITFAQVERREIARTLRMPGRFELRPLARREYRAPAGGAVEVLVQPLQTVTPGTPLYRVSSPQWREVQAKLLERRATIRVDEASLESYAPQREAHQRRGAELERVATVWAERVAHLERLQQSGGARADDLAQARGAQATAKADQATAHTAIAELMAKEAEARARVDAARSSFRAELAVAAALSNVDAERLLAEEGGVPAWESKTWIEVHAVDAGVVETIHATHGAWIEEHAPVVGLLRPHDLQFRARAFQADLGRLRDGLPAAIVPPPRSGVDAAERTTGVVRLGATGDAELRTLDVLVSPDSVPSWARAGVWADLEVIVGGPPAPELAIPLACVIADGTQSLVFRRDPANPDKAIRMEADLGKDDGRWVEVRSGVKVGDEIVLDGAYALMAATSGSITKGGHFHPDGTFHEGDD